MRRNQGLTRADVLVMAVVVAVLAPVIYLSQSQISEDGRRLRCRSHLSCLGKSMATYLNEHGGDQWYPCPLGLGLNPNDYSGAEWIATKYWVGICPNTFCLLCPSSSDTNHEGADVGTDHAVPGRFGSQTISYAGMHYYSLTDDQGNPKAGAIRDDFPSNEAWGSDDTEGTINHPDGLFRRGGMNVLFFDTHIEWKTSEEIDIQHSVGQKGGLLSRLRN
jgi:prepilin-type processing-associated H-X9-DG protein